METRRKMKLGTSDKVILGIGYTVLGIFVLSILIPLVYILMASFLQAHYCSSGIMVICRNVEQLF